MNTMKKTILAALLTSGTFAASVHATDFYGQAQCEAQVSSVYRDADSMEYVGERRFRDGTRMKYAVHSSDPETGYTQTKLAVCWLGNESQQAYSGEESSTMIADVNAQGAVDVTIGTIE